MDTKIKNDPFAVLVIVGLVLNFAIGLAGIELKLPIYLDAIGTIALTLLCGWRVGATIGVLSSLIGGLVNPHLFYFFFTQFILAVVTAASAKHGGFKNILLVILTGIAMGYIAALVSAPAVSLAFGDHANFGPETVENYKNIFTTNLVWMEPLDKVLQCLAAYAFVRLLSHSLKARLRTSANYLQPNGLE